ncbi:MAG: transcription-repair coupling factor [Oscillospiraceae bacterium]|nr:transcription-repair coupling factor [Oscillospiraceae bacterium]
MKALSSALKTSPVFTELLNRIDGGGCPIVLSGVEAVHAAHLAAAVRVCAGVPVVVVCPDELSCERMSANLASLAEEEAVRLMAREFTFYNAESVSRQLEHERLSALASLALGKAPLCVATPDALMQRTAPKQVLLDRVAELRSGEELSPDALCELLVSAGYKRAEQVEGAGQFARRGGIVDFYSPAEPNPVRCEFFGDEIDLMGYFDVTSQRRIENMQSALILPAAETLPQLCYGGEEGLASKLTALSSRLRRRKNPPEELISNIESDAERLRDRLSFSCSDRYLNLLFDGVSSAVEYIPEDAVVILYEPSRLAERAKNYVWRISQDIETLLESNTLADSQTDLFVGWDECCELLAEHPVVMADSFRGGTYPLAPRSLLSVTAKQLPSYGGSLQTAAGDIVHYMKEGYRVVVTCTDERKCGILRDYLDSLGVPSSVDTSLASLPRGGACSVTVGELGSGMEYPSIKLAVITEGQFAAQKPKKASRSKTLAKDRRRLQSFSDLSVGDAVVHEQHGIGRFLGVVKMPVDGVEKDYIKIAYAGTDVLYVPATQLDMVSKYIGGGEDQSVRLNKLGGAEWARSKSRAKASAKEMANELIKLYAERMRRPGHAFSPDSMWQQEFEEAFDYTETDDQLRAAADIKADMEREAPMDRLLCGDVGFGKTEVALRAVMKCVMDGYQAAILVPTTVLANQHYVTVMRRFAGYPVSVELLSRFRTASEIKKALKSIENGTADIVIGTHRLIQKDVKFFKLGLLVVDEEQRFGVSHKEKLKELAGNVDVLSLSATPIPRTLNMALSGLRDMSTISEPPSGRHPVQTYVLEHDWSVICDAIRREVARGGQVYYLHNRVETIQRTAARLSQMLEGVTVAYAHGKMSEDQLSEVMEQVSSGEVQVLVCTTIIETGIDIPNVNTLIIEDADRLGLAQLHQIRGRVGRSSRHAFAYFTFRRGKVLSEDAAKRLATIREFAEFNSGFHIAMRDLEIRGAGNLLGAEQSGHMMSVGFDMYLKLLEEAVLEEKGEKPKKRAECSADLTVSASIPDSYVSSPEQRMDLYRRIALIEDEDDADDMTDELIDRYGDPPKSVNTLIQVALLRGEAAAAGICEIAQKGGRLFFKLTDFDMGRISLLYNESEFRGRIKVEAGTSPAVSIKLTKKDVIQEASQFIKAYKATASGLEKGPEI